MKISRLKAEPSTLCISSFWNEINKVITKLRLGKWKLKMFLLALKNIVILNLYKITFQGQKYQKNHKDRVNCA